VRDLETKDARVCGGFVFARELNKSFEEEPILERRGFALLLEKERTPAGDLSTFNKRKREWNPNSPKTGGEKGIVPL
jgi:hypothetical protein